MTFKDLLGIPENTICHNRSKVDGLEAFYTFLKRYAYPIRYGDMIPLIYVKIFLLVSFFFFLSVFFTDTDDLQDSRRREGTIFYSTLPLPPAHEH